MLKQAVHLLIRILSPAGMIALAVLVLVAALSVVGSRMLDRRNWEIRWEEGRDRVPYFSERTGWLGRAIHESSGVAVSRGQPGVLWTHNDSGDDPALYAVTVTGRLLARYVIRGARARDWEDIAVGPCPDTVTSVSCLYVADTGDNLRARDVLHIYVVAEPAIDTAAATSGTIDLLMDIGFSYPDGSHDTETLGVTPDGDLLLVTKGRTGEINVYRVRPGLDDAEFLSTLPITPSNREGRQATGGAVSRDGLTMVVRTYNELYFLDLQSGGPPGLSPRVCFLAGLPRGGEAVDFYDDSTFVLTTESLGPRPGSIHLVRCN